MPDLIHNLYKQLLRAGESPRFVLLSERPKHTVKVNSDQCSTSGFIPVIDCGVGMCVFLHLVPNELLGADGC